MRLADPGQKRAHYGERCAELANVLRGGFRAGDLRSLDEHARRLEVVIHLHDGSQAAENLGHRADVLDIGHVLQDEGLVGEEGRGHDRQGSVLGAADDDIAGEAGAAFDVDAAHAGPSTAYSLGGASGVRRRRWTTRKRTLARSMAAVRASWSLLSRASAMRCRAR